MPVRLDVAALPFPQPPFQGTVSPREMAERMKNQPKLAVPLLENGEVAHWFALNNWTYPVQGAPARGVAAVQQFFEGMGLSRPPVVQWDKDTLHFTCEPSQVLSGQASLRTTARKWVYASAESDAPWLQLPVSSVSGPQQATLSFKIDAHRMEVGRQHEGHLQVVANAGQQLVLRVLAEVCPPYQPWTRRLLQPFLPAAILGLLYRACLALPADLVGRVWAGPPQPPPGSFAAWLQPPALEGNFIKTFVLTTWWLGALGGGLWLWRRGGRATDALCGAIAGGVAGLIGMATLACLVPQIDFVPRQLWQILNEVLRPGGEPGWAWVWTPAWILLACACWAGLGGGLGLVLSLLGQRGQTWSDRLAAPWVRVFRLFGLKRLTNIFGRIPPEG